MKKILFLSLFISFKMYGQTPKIDVVVGSTENIDGIRAVINKINPLTDYSAITGTNKSTNSLGYGVQGIHQGSGIGVHGQSATGFGVGGYSSNLGVLGIGGQSGILGQTENGTGVHGFSATGKGGFFESETGNALITGIGNVGLGTNTPTKAFLVVDKKIGATHAIFGENTSGVAIESSWPGISFNGYYNGGRKPLSNGFVGGMAMNPNTGLISIYNTFASGTAGNNVTTQDVITMDNFGKVGIGNSSPQAKLHISQGGLRIDVLGGFGKVQLYADDQGTVSGVLPIAFSAYNPNNLVTTLATGIETTFPFNTEEYDLGGFYNNATHEFSAPTSGIYHFDAFVNFGAVSSTTSVALYSLYFYIDNGLSSAIVEPIFAGSFKTLNFSQDVKLNVGQKVKIRVIQTSGGPMQLLGGISSRFTGHLAIRL